MSKQFDKKFKEDAVWYYFDHKDLCLKGCPEKLGVSRTALSVWAKAANENKIITIYNESHQNYGAPKITKVLQSEGEKISEKTVGNYMRELGIRAQYVKPYTVTTMNSDFSMELKNILDEEFNPTEPNAVWCSDITYIWT